MGDKNLYPSVIHDLHSFPPCLRCTLFSVAQYCCFLLWLVNHSRRATLPAAFAEPLTSCGGKTTTGIGYVSIPATPQRLNIVCIHIMDGRSRVFSNFSWVLSNEKEQPFSVALVTQSVDFPQKHDCQRLPAKWLLFPNGGTKKDKKDFTLSLYHFFLVFQGLLLFPGNKKTSICTQNPSSRGGTVTHPKPAGLRISTHTKEVK